MTPRDIPILIFVALANACLWWAASQPINPNASAFPVRSISLNPYQRYQDPFGEKDPTLEEVSRDLEVLKGKTKSVRLYSSVGVLQSVPQLAKQHGMTVTASAWLDARPDNNYSEVNSLLEAAKKHSNVVRAIIGNETQLHRSVPEEELVGFLREARRELKPFRIPVSTAEPWDYWLEHPNLAEEVDFIAIHVLPYWVDQSVEESVSYVLEKYQLVQKAFPKKTIYLAETGWPSAGPQRGAAVPSLANEALFVREFLIAAKHAGLDYNIIEAFDQPWKSETEGRAGAHWGLFDADRQLKFLLTGEIVADPRWKVWTISSCLIGALAIFTFFSRRRSVDFTGKLFAALILQSIATLCVLFVREAQGQYFLAADVWFWSIMTTFMSLLAVIFLTESIEISDVVGKQPLAKNYKPQARKLDSEYPFVSLHVAACREPAEMVIATIESLAALDYPNFEVLVIDNNTLDERLWKPVEARCQELGPRFRFYSLGRWPGFKAGALNFGLKATDPRAQVVGVVDADYIVMPDWLSAAVPYFQDADVAVVQAPQEHRGWEGNVFQQMENDEYSGFFRIGMVQRNEVNAIIQHGTMTLVRRRHLVDAGGWAEWCICEDAELGLKLLNAGYRCIYIDHAFGHGLVPDTYQAYSKQRFRWAYGGMRILRYYAPELLGFRGKLSWRQRYQFVKGWLPWIGDALHMLFTLGALLWSAALLHDPVHTDFPAAVFIYPALGLVALRLFGTVFTYEERVKISRNRIFLAMIAGGALTHTIAKAVLQGLVTKGKPFHRTPKMATSSRLLKSIAMAWEELTLALLLVGASIAILVVHGWINNEARLWAIALVLQAIPYFAALLASIIGGLELQPRRNPSERHNQTKTEPTETSMPHPPLSPVSSVLNEGPPLAKGAP